MKEFIEKLIGRLEEQQAEAENEMHRLRSGDYVLPCSYDITDIKEIASESFKESIEIVNELAEEYINTSTDTSSDYCEWKLIDEEGNVYDTSCRNPHILIDGSPIDNNYEFCPYCGKKIKVVEE